MTVSAFSNALFVVAPPLVQRYTPPELFGTVFGGLFAVTGVLQIAFINLGNLLVNSITTDEKDAFDIKLVAWTVILLPAALMNFALWYRTPPPALGTITMAMVRSASPE